MSSLHTRTPARLRFHPLTVKTFRDLEALFGAKGGCGGCWCMAWRLPRREWESGRGDANRRAFRRVAARGEPTGILAYASGRPVGWCSVAPRRNFPALERSRVLRPLDDEPVWSISCLYVGKKERRRGVSVALLRAAVHYAREQGAKLVEGYPRELTQALPDPFVWTGLLSSFERAGFEEVARRSPKRPIVRAATAIGTARRQITSHDRRPEL